MNIFIVLLIAVIAIIVLSYLVQRLSARNVARKYPGEEAVLTALKARQGPAKMPASMTDRPRSDRS